MSKLSQEAPAKNYYVTVKNDRDKLTTFSNNPAFKYVIFKEDHGITQGILQFKEKKRPNQVKAFLNAFGIQGVAVQKSKTVISFCKELKERSGFTIETGTNTKQGKPEPTSQGGPAPQGDYSKLQEAPAMCKPTEWPKLDFLTPTTDHFAEDEEFGRNSDEEGLSQEY